MRDSSMSSTMRLAAYFNPTGHHVASWRHPRAQVDAHINIRHYIEIAQTAERAKFDMIFLADSVATRDAHMDALSRSVQFVAHLEPLTLLSALATVTDRIGLVATASTTYNEPYHVARKFASLDYISNGRAGWNCVTSVQPAEARNFGRAGVDPRPTRYGRAREFTQVVTGLWDSWDDDAFVRDTESGLFFDPAKLHVLRHKGEYYSVEGPLNVPRPPQGWPVIVQAGASDEGHGAGGGIRRGDLQPASDDRNRQELLRRRQGPHAQIRPRARSSENPAGAERGGGADRCRGRRRTTSSCSRSIHPMVGREILSTMLGGIDLSPYPLGRAAARSAAERQRQQGPLRQHRRRWRAART